MARLSRYTYRASHLGGRRIRLQEAEVDASGAGAYTYGSGILALPGSAYCLTRPSPTLEFAVKTRRQVLIARHRSP